MTVPPVHRATVPDAEARPLRREQEEARQGGDTFADILAALASGHGDASSFLGAQTIADGKQPAEPSRQVAEIFNENGLLRGVTASGEGMAGAPLLGAEARPVAGANAAVRNAAIARGPVSAPVPAAIEPEARPTTPHAEAVGGAGAAARITGQPAAARVRPAPPVFLGLVPRLSSPLGATEQKVFTAAPGQDARAAQRSAPSRLKAALHEYLRQRGSSNAQVSIQAGEEGLAVVARLEKLSREERVRLRSGIVDLLGRHGISAAHIWLNGTRYGGNKS